MTFNGQVSPISSLKWSIAILLALTHFKESVVNCKLFENCELGKLLIANDIDKSELGEWICLADTVSSLNSSKVSGTDPTLSKEFGIFQITNYWRCYSEEKPKFNDCKLNCTDLADDNLDDDIKCAKLVKKRHGFSAWKGYNSSCGNKTLDQYTAGCDFVHGKSPVILNTQTDIALLLNATDQGINCEIEGSQPIKSKWLKFDEQVRENQYPVKERIDLSKNVTSLEILFDRVTSDTRGTYSCVGSSRYGQTRKDFLVRVLDDSDDVNSSDPSVSNSAPSLLILLSVLCTIVLMTVTFYAYYKCRPDRKTVLTKLQLDRFYDGWSDKTEGGKDKDEDRASVYTRIYSKPYRKFEFEIPRQDLFIDQNVILGSGQFGIVHKGTYKGGISVAVKTVKPQETIEETGKQLQALLDEVKVMSFIGQHPNIVSLVGAVTKNLGKGEIYVILEFCPIGNLKSFLKAQRSKTILECPPDNPDVVPSNYMPNPANEPIYVRDFTSYAYQIAYAMDYLTQKKIIHADLASRNVLLSDKRVVKVTDFGLSKRMKDYQEYVKNDQEFVPWRWWAIESLRDFTFTSKSDVWSFGVTLWEIMSLGAVPHPEHVWNPEFSQKLKDGLRLLKPELASDSIYQIMTQCWMEDPNDRPTFQAICAQLRTVLRKMSKFEGDYGELTQCPSVSVVPMDEPNTNL